MWHVLSVNKRTFRPFFGAPISSSLVSIKWVSLEYNGSKWCSESPASFKNVGCINSMHSSISLYTVSLCSFISSKDPWWGRLVVSLHDWLNFRFRCADNFRFENRSSIDIMKSNINRIAPKPASRKFILIWIVGNASFVVKTVLPSKTVDVVCVVFFSCVFSLFVVEMSIATGENRFVIVRKLYNSSENKNYHK